MNRIVSLSGARAAMGSAAGPLAATEGENAFGVYLHWPFCLAKCPYCDFNSHVRHQPVDQARFPPKKAANPRSVTRANAMRGCFRIRIDVRTAPTDSPRRTPPRVFATGRYPSPIH